MPWKVGRDSGSGARENRGREGHGKWEKKGREAGFMWWREAGEKFKKASFRYLLLLTSSQRNEPKNVSWLPFNVLRGLTQNFIHKKSQKTKIRIRDKKTVLPPVKFETFPSHFHHRSWKRWHDTCVNCVSRSCQCLVCLASCQNPW